MGRNLLRIVVAITIVSLLVGLGLFAYNGKFARFWADDYCYSMVAKNDGILKGTSTWYNFNGSRVSSFWFVAIMDQLGLNSLHYLPAFIMALWITGSTLLISSIAALFRRKIEFHWILLASLLILFFVVYLMPTRLQTLYWRMATLHYTMPIPMTLLNLAWIIRLTDKKTSGTRSILAGLAIFLIAFVAGAHGESSAALSVGIYLVVLVIFWISNRVRRENLALRFAIFALAGSIAAVALMAGSSSNEWRLLAMPPPSSLYEFVYYTLRYSLDFVVDSYKTQPLPNFVFMLGSLAVSLAVIKTKEIRFSSKWAALGLVIGLVITFGWVIFSVAPSVFAGVNYPGPRALVPSRFALLGGVFCSLFFLSIWINNLFRRVPQQLWTLAIVIVLLSISAYTIRSYRIPIEEGRYLAGKAELWDKQDQVIRSARAAGEMDIQVPEYNVVDTLDSLKIDPAHWVNGCAAGIYGVNSITAKP